MIPVILTVAGSDPSGGAGIQADIKTISALGGYAASVITAITAQNTLGVQAVFPLKTEEFSTQLYSVLNDLRPQAIKLGMLPHADCIDNLTQILTTLIHKPLIVCDPVMISTSGRRLMDANAVEKLQDKLFPLCTLITPNLQEASFLCKNEISHIDEMKEQAFLLAHRYNTSVLIKGGHLKGNRMCDILYDLHTSQSHIFESPKIHTHNLHGTGCTLSSAIATYLAGGKDLVQAVELSKHYMNQAIEHGKNLKIGQGNGPLWHFFE